MTNEPLHGEIHRMVNRYGFLAILKILQQDATARQLKWEKGKTLHLAPKMANNFYRISKALGECIQATCWRTGNEGLR